MSQANSPNSAEIQMPVGLITVEVVLGNIVSEETDAIVNSTNNSMNLTGKVSTALLAKGGNKILSDCQAKGSIGNTGVFAASASGTKLACKYILHVDIGKRAGILVRECLAEADRLKLKSIALPAIGTGLHGADPELILPAIVSGTEEFVSSVRRPHLRLIRFVVFEQPFMIPIFKRAMLFSLVRPGVRGEELPLGKEVSHEAVSAPAASAQDQSNFFEVPAPTLSDNNMVNDFIQFGAENGVRVSFTLLTGHVTVAGSDAATRMRVQQHIERATSDLQSQSAIARRVRWQYRNDQQDWKDYSRSLNVKIETAHTARQTTLTYRSGGCTFVVDLAHETDTLLEAPGGSVAVRRVDPPVQP